MMSQINLHWAMMPTVAFYAFRVCAFYAFYAWWIYFPQSRALAEGTSGEQLGLKMAVNVIVTWP